MSYSKHVKLIITASLTFQRLKPRKKQSVNILITDRFTFLFIWILFTVLFILSANTHVSFKASMSASFITLIVLSITKSLFGYYVISNTTYATIYGSFSVALFFFLWIYVSWNIYLYGTKLCVIINKDNLKDDD